MRRVESRGHQDKLQEARRDLLQERALLVGCRCLPTVHRLPVTSGSHCARVSRSSAQQSRLKLPQAGGRCSRAKAKKKETVGKSCNDQDEEATRVEQIIDLGRPLTPIIPPNETERDRTMSLFISLFRLRLFAWGRSRSWLCDWSWLSGPLERAG